MSRRDLPHHIGGPGLYDPGRTARERIVDREVRRLELRQAPRPTHGSRDGGRIDRPQRPAA